MNLLFFWGGGSETRIYLLVPQAGRELAMLFIISLANLALSYIMFIIKNEFLIISEIQYGHHWHRKYVHIIFFCYESKSWPKIIYFSGWGVKIKNS